MKTISLFTGCGGLDLGLEEAGFAPACCVEIDPDARATLELNRPGWNLLDEGDVFDSDLSQLLAAARLRPRQAAMVVGGPPCQPFSKAALWHSGRTRRLRDARAKTLRAFLEVVEAALPMVVLLENVEGFLWESKQDVADLLAATFATINRSRGTRYRVQTFQLHAADYGVPQLRRRSFVLAHRRGLELKIPPPTHSPDGWAATDPYRTAWDAIGDLDGLTWDEGLALRGRWAALVPSIPEGHNYLWHTSRGGGLPLFGWRTRYWSFLLKLAKDRPSWTITATPGPATGPIHWRSRLLSLEEVARLQTFPSGYKILGSRESALQQLGNAVPPALGELLGLAIAGQFFGRRWDGRLHLIPARRPDCPPPEAIGRVPRCYGELVGRHRAHPGVGKGPGARRRRRR